MTTLPNKLTSPNVRRTPRLQVNASYLFVLPYVVFLTLFGVLPGIIALVFSVSKFVGGRPQLFAAGTANFTTVFKDARCLTLRRLGLHEPLACAANLFLQAHDLGNHLLLDCAADLSLVVELLGVALGLPHDLGALRELGL